MSHVGKEMECREWISALRGLVVGPEPATARECAENVRARLAKMGGTEPVYLEAVLKAAEDMFAGGSMEPLRNAVLFARQVQMGRGSKANWLDLNGGDE